MTDAPYIPQKTIEELASSHPKGTRHAAMITIAMPLIGNGMPPNTVFEILRGKFPDEDKSDKEIQGVVNYCISKNPTPSGYGTQQQPAQHVAYERKPAPTKAPEKSVAELAAEFLGGDSMTIEQATESSPVKIDGNHASLAFRSLYRDTDCLNIVTKFSIVAEKAVPSGGGKTLKRDEWCVWFEKRGIPKSEAGAWLRLNPCAPTGSGSGGAVTDADIASFRYLLLESDSLPIESQLAFYFRLCLPIAAITSSGGSSMHALVHVGARDKEHYTELAKRILETLKPFGFDPANKNPSRLSRLPGAARSLGAVGDGVQRLVYLNPTAPVVDDATVRRLEAQLKPPFINQKPMLPLAREAGDRYEELFENRGKTGLHTGLPTFDRRTGGLKKNNLILIAAETNVGKSTLCANIYSHATRAGNTTALFSLEVDKGEIVDMLLSMNFSVDRNLFNTGDFNSDAFKKITTGLATMKNWPLHVFDDPNQTVDTIRDACIKLRDEQDLKLIVIDYLQLISPPPFFKDSREQQVAYIGRALKNLAKECRVPLIAVSQLNEEGKIRESRAVSHDAHIVFILEAGDAVSEMTLRITKGRSIQKGKIELHFEPEFCRIRERSPVESPEHYTSNY